MDPLESSNFAGNGKEMRWKKARFLKSFDCEAPENDDFG